MNKTILIMISIIVILLAIITAVFIFKPNQKEIPRNIETRISEEQYKEEEKREKIEEVRETEEIGEKEEIVTTDSDEEKVSPNAFITFETTYNKCGHTKKEFLEVTEQMVNKTKKEIEELYTGWNIKKFTRTEIILSKKEEGECGEHYLIKEKNNVIVIYEILSNGKEKEYETTDISTEYITKEDKERLKKGIRLNGKAELNQFIEDFE